MIFSDLIFYVFSLMTIFSAVFVVISRNPVHSVLWLILSFISVVCLFVLLKAEFLAMLLMIVYVGAVAVLFLFVVMMLDVDFAELKTGLSKYIPIAVLIGSLIIFQFLVMIGNWKFSKNIENNLAAKDISEENTIALGKLLYTEYVLLFQLAGLVLLVAMVGSIVLTLRHKENFKKQNIIEQIYRSPKETVELKKVKQGEGL